LKYLVDTNVVSELRKGPRAALAVVRWFESIDSDAPFLSVLTLGEIRSGIERIRRRDSQASVRLEGWLEQLAADYGDRILPVDGAIADEWGRMTARRALPVIDGLLAATARVNGLTVATRNSRDVAATGVPVVNPFEFAWEGPSAIADDSVPGRFSVRTGRSRRTRPTRPPEGGRRAMTAPDR
jgi:predicted nucleic acid-binding protein